VEPGADLPAGVHDFHFLVGVHYFPLFTLFRLAAEQSSAEAGQQLAQPNVPDVASSVMFRKFLANSSCT